jgi:hypothetical protein
MQQKHLSEMAKLMNIAIKNAYIVEAEWDNFKYDPDFVFRTILIFAGVEIDCNGGEHLYCYNDGGKKFYLRDAKVRQHSPDTVPFTWNMQDGCSWKLVENFPNNK